MIPLKTVTLMECPVCGRDDRYRPFTGKSHYIGGAKCAGTPVPVTYVRQDPMAGEIHYAADFESAADMLANQHMIPDA